jgi:hypothetical protein
MRQPLAINDYRSFHEQYLRDETIHRLALSDLARDRVARDHFRERVVASSADKHMTAVAMSLGSLAIMSDGQFEVTTTHCGLASQTRLGSDRVRDALLALQSIGLIEILQPGRGRGRPSRIRLVIQPQHETEISLRTQAVIQEQIAAVEHRVAATTAIST